MWTPGACASGSTCSTRWRTMRPTAGTRRSSAATAGLSAWAWQTARRTISGCALSCAGSDRPIAQAQSLQLQVPAICQLARLQGLHATDSVSLAAQTSWRPAQAKRATCIAEHPGMAPAEARCRCARRRMRPRASRTCPRGRRTTSRAWRRWWWSLPTRPSSGAPLPGMLCCAQVAPRPPSPAILLQPHDAAPLACWRTDTHPGPPVCTALARRAPSTHALGCCSNNNSR